MSAVNLKVARDTRIVRAARQERRSFLLHANRNYAAAARWDRALLRALAAERWAA